MHGQKKGREDYQSTFNTPHYLLSQTHTRLQHSLIPQIKASQAEK